MPQTGLCGRLAQPYERAHHVGPTVHRRPHLPVVQVVATGPCVRRGDTGRRRQRCLDIAGFYVVPERCVDLVEGAGAGLDGPRLEHQVPAEGLCLNPVRLQRLFHGCVAGDAVGIVQPRPVNRPRPGFGHQIAQDCQRLAFAQVIVDEHRNHRPAACAGRCQGGMIAQPQVAAIP